MLESAFKLKNNINDDKYLFFISLFNVIYLLSKIIAVSNNTGKKYLACTPYIIGVFSGVQATYKLVYIKTTIPINIIRKISFVFQSNSFLVLSSLTKNNIANITKQGNIKSTDA